MTKRLACHYAVVRFSPYPETDEFANVGVLLACPALGYLEGKRADLRRRGRVGHFFPELDPNVYKAAVLAWDDMLATHRRVPTEAQLLTTTDQVHLREAFLTLTRPRESILYYSEPRVILSEDPAQTLDEVFGAYVERRFASANEYQERVMCQRLEKVLGDAHLLSRYLRNEAVGNDLYHVRFPFVKRPASSAPPLQAIKALYLDRDESTDIIRHADAWVSPVRRLRQYGTAPEALLYVLQGPSDRGPAHRQAFAQVQRDLDQEHILHVTIESAPEIAAFAGRPE